MEGDTNILPDLFRLRDVFCEAAGLHDVTLSVAEGEFLALLGPTGTGVLALAAGLVRPDRGEILLDGRTLTRVPAHRRGVGMVFAGENLFGHLSVAGNIALPLHGRSDARAREARVGRMLGLWGISALGDRLPAELSPTERLRSALARALVTEPRLLLLDEPLGRIDPAERARLAGDLRHLLRHHGVGVIMATRHGADACAMADRAAVLVDGTVVRAGTPAELYERPGSAAVAACTGEINRLSGILRALEDDIAVVTLDCGVVIEAARADAEIVGARCVVLLRPEHVAVAATEADAFDEEAVPATVQDLVEMGDHIRLVLAVGKDAVVARRPTGVRAGFAPGAAVAIAWQPHHAHAARP